jgi:hypothetical protein
LNFECVKILCDIDVTVVRDKCTFPTVQPNRKCGQLPLHVLIQCPRGSTAEVSDKGDCFRFLLQIYPAAAGIKDDHSNTLYDLAVARKMKVYFRRLLLAAVPALDPIERRELNYQARRQGMFLVFRAVSSDKKSTIWANLCFEGLDCLQHVIPFF